MKRVPGASACFFMKHLDHEWHRGEFTISTDPNKLNLEVIHRFLSETSYWARNRSRATVKFSLEHTLNFGLNRNEQQIGFARLVTDHATFAWLADVFVIEEYRGQGLGHWLIESVVSYEPLLGLHRWMLATWDAHDLYRKFGFTELERPDRWMERKKD
jgi:GNAT superfamily N-acetyltransferase